MCVKDACSIDVIKDLEIHLRYFPGAFIKNISIKDTYVKDAYIREKYVKNTYVRNIFIKYPSAKSAYDVSVIKNLKMDLKLL